MAKYNTFVVIDCKKRRNVLVTSSAKKSRELLKVGIKIEVWNENELKEIIYFAKRKNNKDAMNKYVAEEKAYHMNKQFLAEKKNKERRERRNK